MKSINKYVLGMAAVVGTLLVFSCTKSFKDPQPQSTDLNNKSLVQVFIATVNANRNVVMIDGKRVSRPTLTSGTSFPTSVYPSTNTGSSFAVEGGVRGFTILDTLSTTTQKPLTFTTNMDVGKSYTIFTYDTITSPKQVTVETPIETITDGTARLRFGNFIHDVNATPAVDVYSRLKQEVIFSNVNRTEVTPFITWPSYVGDTLDIRQTGTSTVLATHIGFIPHKNRVYTLVYRGSHRGTRVTTVLANY
jgi:hypothetical protein